MQARVLNVQVPAERCQERMTAYTDLLTRAGDAPGCAGSLLVGDDTTVLPEPLELVPLESATWR
jgi:hypothetical protein